jgi:predicted enzyme related to lactoylglutathione lyase
MGGHPVGTFCFAELVSPDPESARQFYADLFGWTAEEIPGPSHSYWLFHIEGRLVAGLRPIARGRQRWIPYVAVERLGATVALAERLNARVGDEPFEVSGIARMATIVDPHDRVIGLWEANGRSGVERQREPGSLWWVEMLAHDITGARYFYSTLFGWKVSDRPLAHLTHPYTVFAAGSQSVGGAIAIERQWGRVPERWQVLFEVADVTRTIDQAEGLGGSEDLPLVDIPGVGRCASLRDDRQALFFAMEPTPAASSS